MFTTTNLQEAERLDAIINDCTSKLTLLNKVVDAWTVGTFPVAGVHTSIIVKYQQPTKALEVLEIQANDEFISTLRTVAGTLKTKLETLRDASQASFELIPE
jgi:hypothetical protein